MVWLFTFLRSIQNLRLPSFFWTRTTALVLWTVWLPDSTNIQHLLDIGPHIVVHVGWYTSVTLLEGCPIHHLYFVFDQSSFTQVQITVCKQVFPFQQQLSGLLLLWFRPFFETLDVQGLQHPSLLAFVVWLFCSPGWLDYQSRRHLLSVDGLLDQESPNIAWDFLRALVSPEGLTLTLTLTLYLT